MEILKVVDEGQLFFVGDVKNTSLIAGSREILVEKFQLTPTVTVSVCRLSIKNSLLRILMLKLFLSHNLDHYFSQSSLG